MFLVTNWETYETQETPLGLSIPWLTVHDETQTYQHRMLQRAFNSFYCYICYDLPRFIQNNMNFNYWNKKDYKINFNLKQYLHTNLLFHTMVAKKLNPCRSWTKTGGLNNDNGCTQLLLPPTLNVAFRSFEPGIAKLFPNEKLFAW